MASGPSLSSGTQERQKEARNVLTTEVEDAITTFLTTLDNVAVTHGRCVICSSSGNWPYILTYNAVPEIMC
jgi:hypothetical protein